MLDRDYANFCERRQHEPLRISLRARLWSSGCTAKRICSGCSDALGAFRASVGRPAKSPRSLYGPKPRPLLVRSSRRRSRRTEHGGHERERLSPSPRDPPRSGASALSGRAGGLVARTIGIALGVLRCLRMAAFWAQGAVSDTIRSDSYGYSRASRDRLKWGSAGPDRVGTRYLAQVSPTPRLPKAPGSAASRGDLATEIYDSASCLLD